MDAILDVFYEVVFAPLPRGALLSRYKREEIVEYLGTVIYGCVSAGQVRTDIFFRSRLKSAIAILKIASWTEDIHAVTAKRDFPSVCSPSPLTLFKHC